MSYYTKFKVICSACNHIQSGTYTPSCEQCGGLVEARFDLSKVRFRDSDNPYERYFDLIPVSDFEFMPKTGSMTPMVHATKLGEKIGLENLYLKDETANPTGTTKYRMAAVSLPYLFEGGVKHFCASSTGNSSTAYACSIDRIPDLKMSLFTGDEFRNRVNYESSEQITHYILYGASFAEAFNVAADFAKKLGHTSEKGFFNIGRREGLKLVWLEAVEQIKKPIDWYVQAVSSGMGVYGVYKAAKELKALGITDRLPKLLCAQQESCSPMARAWAENCESIEKRHIVEKPEGLAKAILRGDPSRVYPYMRDIVIESGGTFASVSEDQIKEARKLVMDLEGIDICYSASTAVASVIKLAREGFLNPSDTIMVNLTGSDRTYDAVPQDVIHLHKENGEWIE